MGEFRTEVPAEATGERLDRYLTEQGAGESRTAVQKLIASGLVTVDDVACTKPSFKLGEGSAIVVLLPEDAPTELTAEPDLLQVIYEDATILVVNKPAGVIVHPESFRDTGTIVQAALSHVPGLREAIHDQDLPLSRLRPGIVHRLDKDTSGTLVIAKTRAALLALARAFHDRLVSKEYTALLAGELKERITVNEPIGRKPTQTFRMGVVRDPERGKAAISTFSPIRSFAIGNQVATLARVSIETGRTHQIRVHAKHLGMPVVGDSLYANRGSKALSEKHGVTRQLLHATHLAFPHPETGRVVVFTAPLPQDMRL